MDPGAPTFNFHPMIPQRGRIRSIHLALLIAAIILAYLNAFRGAFQYDDFRVIVDNPAVHSMNAWLHSLGGIRPLLKASYALNWVMGSSPLGFHVVNVGLHVLNALLLYAILLRFPVQMEDRESSQAMESVAFVAALLWALHPVQTEAVTYICGRSVALMATFYLASILSYIHGREIESWAFQWLLSPLLFLMALLTKETAVTLPAALALWEWTAWPKRKRPFMGPVVHWALLGGMAVILALNADYQRLVAHGFQARGVMDNLRSEIHAVTWLLGRLLWPSHLNIDPLLPTLTRWTWGLACEAALLLGFMGVGVWNLRHRAWITFGILWGFLHLAPTNSVLPRLDLVNERQLYLASMGFVFVLSVGLLRVLAVLPQKISRLYKITWSLGWRPGISGRSKTTSTAQVILARPLKWLEAGFLILAVGLGVGTFLRNQDYKTEITLWASSVGADPKNPRAFNNLGTAYGLARDYDKAAQAYREALRLQPNYPLAKKNLAALLE